MVVRIAPQITVSILIVAIALRRDVPQKNTGQLFVERSLVERNATSRAGLLWWK
jgi:hypothetical protein